MINYEPSIDGANLTLEELEGLGEEIRCVLINNTAILMKDYIQRALKVDFSELGYRKCRALRLELKLESCFPDEVYRILHERTMLVPISFFRINNDDKKFILQNALKGTKWLAQKMYTDRRGVREIAKHLGISIAKESNEFLPEEINFIKKHADKGIPWISKTLNHPIHSIRSKACSLGIETRDCSVGHRFTPEEDEIIKTNLSKGRRWLATCLGRSLDSIRARTKTLKLKVPFVHSGKVFHQFTNYEDNFIRNNADKGLVWIARRLNLSTDSIANRTRVKKISIKRMRKDYTQDEDRFIKNNIHRGIEFLADYFGVTKQSVTLKLKRMRVVMRN
jgi:hypothetical protein